MKRIRVPWSIKYAIAVNILFIIDFVFCSLAAAFLGFVRFYPMLFSKAEEMGVRLDSTQLILLLIASVLLWLLPIPLLLYINRGMLNQRKNMRWVQISVSVFFLASFPVSTVLHGIIIYCFLLDQNTRDYLMGSPKNV